MSKQITITILDDGSFDWSATGGLNPGTTIMLLEMVKLSILNGQFIPETEEEV
jgi:hypothetical protein